MNDLVKWYDGTYIRKSIEGRDNDAWLVVEILNHDEYKLNSINFKNVKTILDVGASIGIFSVLIHKRFPKAKIKCIDPNPHTIEILRKNVENFAEVVEGCVSYEKDVYMIFGNNDYEASVSSNPQNKDFKVQPYTLKELIPNRCDLLKLDCEGVEYDIFEREDLSDIKYIIGEWHNTDRWNSFMINYVSKNNYWNYTVLKQHETNGNFYMKNRLYE